MQFRLVASILLLALSTTACQGTAADKTTASVNAETSEQPVTAVEPVIQEPDVQTLPKVLVHKSSSCGCCGSWVEHMQKAGFEVAIDETDELEPIRKRLGVPFAKGSCHTAEIGGYFVEGHVPADDIKRLLADGSKVRGLVLPGMPIGSPGMESPDGRVQPYTVELVELDGSTRPFANHH